MLEVFPMIPASSKALWFIWALLALMLGLAGLFAYVGWSTYHVRFEVSPAGLTIRGDMFGRTIPHHALIPDQARSMDLGAVPEYRPKRRTMGTGLPGYQAGWFRLQNGEKALVFLTQPARVVYVPTREGFSVLMSVEDPDAFLRALTGARAS